jgi:predicted alpha/beta superfamily hydrolase
MKFIPVFLLLGCLAACSSHHTDKNHTIAIGKTITIYSKILGEERPVLVHLPGDNYGPASGGSGSSDSQHSSNGPRYPVVYLLDGEGHFPSVSGMIQQLSEVNGNSVSPDMIVIGIVNTDRERDLTPTHATTDFRGNNTASSGGGEKFMAFIEKELIPHIDSLYPTAPWRMLIGHSLGGLTVINTLVHHPQLFNAYLAIDPSMWWDNQRLLHAVDTALATGDYKSKTLYLALANTMPQGGDTGRVRKDTTHNTFHIRSILQLADALKRSSRNGLRWSYKYYDGDSHGSVPLIAEYDALHFIFSSYNAPYLLPKLYDSSTDAASALTAIRDYYTGVSQQMGYKISPPEDNINGLAYDFLGSKMPEKARAFFQLNIDNYPGSGNTYDGMGDYYAALGDKQKAIDYYSKAFALSHDPETKRKLDKLKG